MSQSLAKKEELSEVSDDNARKAKQLPTPKGYKILITLPEPEEKTDCRYGLRIRARLLQRSTAVPFWAVL